MDEDKLEYEVLAGESLVLISNPDTAWQTVYP
jgi:hypothetical protein